jgi:hypothetical protein
MAVVRLPTVSTALLLGDLSLQSATSENVFFHSEVYGRENYTDEYSMGIATAAGIVTAGRPYAGFTMTDITEAGSLDELKNNNFLGTRPWAYWQKNPGLLVERPHYMPVDIDVRENQTVNAQFTDLATATHLLQYRVKIYIEYEEI